MQKELLETERSESSKRIDALEKDQVEKDREIESCKERLKNFADYDELRRELEIMKVSLLGIRLPPRDTDSRRPVSMSSLPA